MLPDFPTPGRRQLAPDGLGGHNRTVPDREVQELRNCHPQDVTAAGSSGQPVVGCQPALEGRAKSKPGQESNLDPAREGTRLQEVRVGHRCTGETRGWPCLVCYCVPM